MSRLPLADPQDLPTFLKCMHEGAGADDWSTRHCARAFAAHPDILERYLAFYYPFHATTRSTRAMREASWTAGSRSW